MDCFLYISFVFGRVLICYYCIIFVRNYLINSFCLTRTRQNLYNLFMKKQKAQKPFRPFSYMKKYKLMAFFVPVLKAIGAIIEIFVPLIMSYIIDVGIKNNDVGYIWTMASIILGLNLVAIITDILGQYYTAKTVECMSRDMRHDIFVHVNSLSHSELDKFSTAEILNRTVEDVYQIKTGIGSLLRTTVRIPFILVGSLVMAISINLKLSLIFLIASPILVLSVLLIMKKISPLLKLSKQKLDKTSNVTRENLTGVRVVRAFNKQNFETARFQTANYEQVNTDLKIVAWSSVLPSLIYTIVNFAIIAILYFGGIEVNIGGISQGNLIAFINYFGRISTALVAIARIITLYTRMSASTTRINEVMTLKNSITDPAKPIEIDLNDPQLSAVEFNDVSFSYNNIKNAIENLSIKVEPGQTIGVIGGTGSGKSSVVYLIPRFYDATKGTVLIGGENVKKYRVTDLRKMIGIVPQNPTLFEGTIASNMRWRKPDATDEEIIKALKISQSYDFVKEYPDFLNHKVNRGGTNFSGGQRQRLTIARALVDNPKILILDDSTSALDFATDTRLRKSIKTMLSGTTTFIVSQRTNSIRDADQIIVLDNGKVVGLGKHEELLENCLVYREIHNSQNKGDK